MDFNFTPYLSKIIGMLSPMEWKTWILVIVVVSCMTETVKRVFLPQVTAVRRKQLIYAVAFITGLISAIVGYHITKEHLVSEIMWLMIGFTSGPIANFLHWITLGIVAWRFPGLAAALKGSKPSAN